MILRYTTRRLPGGILDIEFNRSVSAPVREALKEAGFKYVWAGGGSSGFWRGRKNHEIALAIAERAVAYSEKYTQAKADTLCWRCAHADKGGASECPWVRDFQPVDGWDADRLMMNTHWEKGEAKKTESYFVRACPLFQSDGRTEET